jgi:hypothetical protein
MQRREARLGILDGCCAGDTEEGFEGCKIVVGGGEEDGLCGVVYFDGEGGVVHFKAMERIWRWGEETLGFGFGCFCAGLVGWAR